MDADGKARDVGYQDYPAVAAWTVSRFLPFQYQPEHQGREERGESIDLSLDSREPEGVAKGVSQRTHHSARFDGDDLSKGHGTRGREQGADKVRNGQEQEEDAARTQECRQQIDHQRYLRRLAGKLGEEVGHQHKDGRPGWMSDFQFVTTRDEFRTVPQAGRRLNGETIHHSGDGKHEPRHTGVEFRKGFLLHHTFALNRAQRYEENQWLPKTLPDICLTFD